MRQLGMWGDCPEERGMKQVQRPGGKRFARNGTSKWHFVYPSKRQDGYEAPCKFNTSGQTEYSDDAAKPANEVCKNCRIYAFHWGW